MCRTCGEDPYRLLARWYESGFSPRPVWCDVGSPSTFSFPARDRDLRLATIFAFTLSPPARFFSFGSLRLLWFVLNARISTEQCSGTLFYPRRNPYCLQVMLLQISLPFSFFVALTLVPSLVSRLMPCVTNSRSFALSIFFDVFLLYSAIHPLACQTLFCRAYPRSGALASILTTTNTHTPTLLFPCPKLSSDPRPSPDACFTLRTSTPAAVLA